MAYLFRSGKNPAGLKEIQSTAVVQAGTYTGMVTHWGWILHHLSALKASSVPGKIAAKFDVGMSSAQKVKDQFEASQKPLRLRANPVHSLRIRGRMSLVNRKDADS